MLNYRMKINKKKDLINRNNNPQSNIREVIINSFMRIQPINFWEASDERKNLEKLIIRTNSCVGKCKIAGLEPTNINNDVKKKQRSVDVKKSQGILNKNNSEIRIDMNNSRNAQEKNLSMILAKKSPSPEAVVEINSNVSRNVEKSTRKKNKVDRLRHIHPQTVSVNDLISSFTPPNNPASYTNKITLAPLKIGSTMSMETIIIVNPLNPTLTFSFQNENELNQKKKIAGPIVQSFHLRLPAQIPINVLKEHTAVFNKLDDVSKFHSYNHQSISKKNKTLKPDPIFTYTFRGMYKQQIEPYMVHRINWKVDGRKGVYPNFTWKYHTRKVDFRVFRYDHSLPQEKLKVINLFEKNAELGNKKYFFINLIKYCDAKNINVFEIVPFTIIFSNGKKIGKNMQGFHEIFSFVKSLGNSHKDGDSKGVLANKLYRDYFEFENCNAKLNNVIVYIPNTYLSQKNYWIIKPVDLCQGMCVQISNDEEEIKKQLAKLFKGADMKYKDEIGEKEKVKEKEKEKEKEEEDASLSENEKEKEKEKKINNCKYYASSIVLQKYLDYPLLYKKRKFDIRIFVLVDFWLNVYMFKEGHLKTSSVEYEIDNPNKFIHITNYSLQKHCLNFQKYEEGNESSFQDLKEDLKKENIDLSIWPELILKIKILIEVSMNSVGRRIRKRESVLSFQVFGYDMIIDNELKPWILEINDNPGLAITSPVTEMIHTRMIDDALRMTIDKMYDTKYDNSVINPETGEYKSKFTIPGYSDSENMFEYLCNIDIEPEDANDEEKDEQKCNIFNHII